MRLLSVFVFAVLSCGAQGQLIGDRPLSAKEQAEIDGLNNPIVRPSLKIVAEDRLELFKIQRDLSAIQAQFLQMKSQYEDAVKKMQERAEALEKKFSTLKAKLQSVCSKDATLDEQEGTCVAKPPAPVSMQQAQPPTSPPASNVGAEPVTPSKP
jgi:uncharacterized protein YhaN